jgi:hypothetical protein
VHYKNRLTLRNALLIRRDARKRGLPMSCGNRFGHSNEPRLRGSLAQR